MSGNDQLRSLGIIYCVAYVVSFIVFSLALWLIWDSWRGDNIIDLLGDVSSASAGTALLTIIGWEGLKYLMVLFAAGRIKKLKEEGRQEGLEEGLQEGRKEGLHEGLQEGRREGREEGLHEGQQAEREKWEAWYRRFLEAQANGQPFNEPPPPQG